MGETKRCSVCREVLPRELFSKDSGEVSGLSCRCKKCQSIRFKKYREENKEKLKEKARLKYSSENHKEYYQAHKEEYKQGLQRRRLNNPDLYNSFAQKRIALRHELPSTLTAKEWRNCKEYFNGECAYCGVKSDKLTFEHFIPISKFGEYGVNNIIPACKSCNPSKSNNSFSSWYPAQPFYSKAREQKILKYLGYTNGVQQLSLM